jgi:hypothetical protein
MKRMRLMVLAIGLSLLVQIARADWAPSKRLTWNSGSSYCPAMPVYSSGNVHVVWEDDTPGNYEIYYGKYVK